MTWSSCWVLLLGLATAFSCFVWSLRTAPPPAQKNLGDVMSVYFWGSNILLYSPNTAVSLFYWKLFNQAVNSLQMILYDTPGVIEKKMHKLDSMMMKNVRSAAINADCVVVVVDARKMPEKVCFSSPWISRLHMYWQNFFIFQIDEVLKEGVGDLKEKLPTLLVLNKKDLIKPGEIAKKLQVCAIYLKKDLYSNFIFKFLSHPIAYVLEQTEYISSVIFMLPKLEILRFSVLCWLPYENRCYFLTENLMFWQNHPPQRFLWLSYLELALISFVCRNCNISVSPRCLCCV